MFTKCTSSLDLHMLIVPFRYLFGTLLVPKVATGMVTILGPLSKALKFRPAYRFRSDS